MRLIKGSMIVVGLTLAVVWGRLDARQGSGTVRIDADDIGGVVTSSKGPEGGVWVIAETKDLPTPYRKIVVTDDAGRYVVPDLPKARYDIWVRGYGLVDSPKVQTEPGKLLNLAAVVAPNPQAAAQYYPGSYWLALVDIPAKSEFPGTGNQGNGIAATMKAQEEFLGLFTTNGCSTCHAMGTRITREMPKGLGPFKSTYDAWDRRLESGQSGSFMSNQVSQLGRRRGLQMLADWTDRIASGAVPPAPPRPSGVERNVVITSWDWGSASEFVHDEIATDERHPTINANGLVYGTMEFSGDAMLVLDPVKNTVSRVGVEVLDKKNLPPEQWARSALQPSPYWGEDIFWNSRTIPHNPMMDSKGRVWLTTLVRPEENQPAWCKAGSSHPSAQYFPLNRSSRQLSVFDPKTKTMTPIDTCFSTHHLDMDWSDRIWFDTGPVPGFFDMKIWDATHDAAKSQGWIPAILDTNGNGKPDEYVGPNAPVDPKKDKRIDGGGYDVSASPTDGSIWWAQSGTPGRLVRVSPGSNPPLTSIAEVYDVPPTDGAHTVRGGPELDMNGVAWVALGSGHMASFDRRKCKVLNGPTATGKHCAEGWKMYREPGPKFKGTETGTDAHYLTWVDQANTFGLGENVPMATGNNSESIVAMLPGGKFVTLHVPYPLGFFPKGMDGRIDDPKGGWKGRGLWSTQAGQPMWHQERGKGETPKAVKFQLRPDPLAK
jgi:hypothetical protein